MWRVNHQATEEVWSRYVEEDCLDLQAVRFEVANSWQRCRDLRVDPFAIVDGSAHRLELRDRLQQRRHLVEVARPFMANLYNFVRGSGFQVILADEDGFLLEVIGDGDILTRTRRVQLSPGGNWTEAVKGTNAIGTALVERRPVQIHAWEHYCQPHHFLTCSAAPIVDPEGRQLGVLDITGDYQLANAHTLGMVVAAVNAIENQLRLQKTTTKLYAAYRYSNTLLDSMSDGLISVDTAGVITEINANGARILGVHPTSARGKHINAILQRPAPMLELLASGREYRDKPIPLAALGKTIFSSATLLHDDAGQVIGAVAVLREDGQPARNPAVPPSCHSFGDIIGTSPALCEARQWAEAAAAMPTTVLLVGESGTGKELFARAIHHASPRQQAPFVALNCAAIPETLIESELFGYEEGSFTGARKGGQAGKFELAQGGTIFLDEIGDMPLGVQAKLLRVLQEKRITRIGSVREVPVDIRILAATHRDLSARLREGLFREDLYYRLNVIAIRIPPLRERPEDLPLLARCLLERIGSRLGRAVQAGDDFLAGLATHPWPGNIRELENVLERAILRAGGDGRLTTAHIDFGAPAASAPAAVPTPAAEGLPAPSLRQLEQAAITSALSRHHGNISQAAADLGIGRNTLYRKIRAYGLGS